MGGYLSFKSSGFLFQRLTEQHPLTRLPHAIGLRVFTEAHRGISPDVEVGKPAYSAGHDFGRYELSIAESSALARALALERADLCLSSSVRSSVPPKATETMQHIVSPPRTSVIEN
jgi:hypothetical protein